MENIKVKKFILLLIFIIFGCLLASSQIRNQEKIPITIMSYNIHSGSDKNMVPSLFDTIDFLKKSRADVICLQEVNESAKVGFQVSSLKEELKMYSHFGANINDDDTSYGLVTYSKYKILSKKHVYLSSKKEQRGLLHTIIKVKNKKLHVLNAHLGIDDDERKIQLKEIRRYIENLKNENFIILGDFNQGDLDISDEIATDVAKYLNKSNSLTFSSGLERIDYIFVSKNIEVEDYKVLIENMSDHYPIITKILL